MGHFNLATPRHQKPFIGIRVNKIKSLDTAMKQIWQRQRNQPSVSEWNSQIPSYAGRVQPLQSLRYRSPVWKGRILSFHVQGCCLERSLADLLVMMVLSVAQATVLAHGRLLPIEAYELDWMPKGRIAVCKQQQFV